MMKTSKIVFAVLCYLSLYYFVSKQQLLSFYSAQGIVLKLGLQLKVKSGWSLHDGAYIITEGDSQ